MAQDWKSTDLEAGLERAEAGQEQTTLGTSRSSRGWKTGQVLLAIGLCAAAAVCYAIHDKRWDIADKSKVLTHTLRQISERDILSRQTAIHLEGDYNATTSTIEWNNHGHPAFHKGLLKLSNNEIIIPKKGLYFVYSQVSFRINCHMRPEEEQQKKAGTVLLSHKVKCMSQAYGTELGLLSEQRSSCNRVPAEEESGQRWYDAISLGAVFSLDEGDRLYTSTDPDGANIDCNSGETYFGVFAV